MISVGETKTTSGTGTSVVIDKPANLAINELLIARIAISSNPVTITPPAGFTSTITTDDTSVGSAHKSQIFQKVATSADVSATNFTFTLDGSINYFGSLTRIVAEKTTTPVAASSGQANNTSTTITASTVTPTTANSLVMFFTLFGDNTGSISTYALTTSSPTFTEAHDSVLSWAVVSMAHGVRPETTATGNATATHSGNAQDNIGQLVVINPRQEFTVSDTLTGSDTFTSLLGLIALVTDTLNITDTITSTVKRLWENATKSVTTWINTDKN